MSDPRRKLALPTFVSAALIGVVVRAVVKAPPAVKPVTWHHVRSGGR